MDEKRFMDVGELAAYLGISKWLIYKYISLREIPFIPFGRLVRFDRLAVEKWAEKRMIRGFRGEAPAAQAVKAAPPPDLILPLPSEPAEASWTGPGQIDKMAEA